MEDTLESICLRFSTTAQNIKRNNKEIDIYAGEWIEIETGWLIHIVKPADSLKSVADKYSIEPSAIRRLNALDDDRIYIGQHLKICEI